MRAVSSATRAGIVDAGARCIIRDGVAHATMSAISAECGVSKALLHYHFADRAQLLAESAQLLGRRLVTRERRALEHADAASAIDVLWHGQGREMERGELRALLVLGSVREPEVQEERAKVTRAARIAGSSIDNPRAFRQRAHPLPASLVGLP